MLDLTVIDQLNRKIADAIYSGFDYMVCIYNMDLSRNAYIEVKSKLRDIEVDLDKIRNDDMFQRNLDLMSDIEKFMLYIVAFHKDTIISHVKKELLNNSFFVCENVCLRLLNEELSKVYKQLPEILAGASHGLSRQMVFNERIIDELYTQCKINYTRGQSNTLEFLALIYNKALKEIEKSNKPKVNTKVSKPKVTVDTSKMSEEDLYLHNLNSMNEHVEYEEYKEADDLIDFEEPIDSVNIPTNNITKPVVNNKVTAKSNSKTKKLENKITDIKQKYYDYKAKYNFNITEESTKNWMVVPFIQALGYDITTDDVISGYTCNIGGFSNEKVDFALQINTKPSVLIKCIKLDSMITNEHISELYRCYNMSDAKIGIITNGKIYKFFKDTIKQNIMDLTPFFEFDIATVNAKNIEEIIKYMK